MFSPQDQFTIITNFLISINDREVKNLPICLLEKDDGPIYVFFDPSQETKDEYYKRILNLSLASKYTVIYIPDNMKGYIRVFFEFLDPEDRTYANWFLSRDGNLIPYDKKSEDFISNTLH